MSIKVQKVKVDYNEMPQGVTYYFIGQPKTGKSTQASKWSEKGQDGVLVLDTDLGADFVDGANVVPIVFLNDPLENIKTKDGDAWKVIPPLERGYVYRNGPNKGEPMPVYSLSEVKAWLVKDFHKLPYDTIVIDTIDQVNEWVEDLVKEKLKINEMGMGDFGADWAKARRLNVTIAKEIQQLVKKNGANLIIVSHSKKSMTQDGKVQLGPSLPAGLGRALTAKADIIGFTEIKKGNNEYTINFKAYDERSNGSRFKPLAQKILPFNYESIKKEILEYK